MPRLTISYMIDSRPGMILDVARTQNPQQTKLAVLYIDGLQMRKIVQALHPLFEKVRKAKLFFMQSINKDGMAQ